MAKGACLNPDHCTWDKRWACFCRSRTCDAPVSTTKSSVLLWLVVAALKASEEGTEVCWDFRLEVDPVVLGLPVRDTLDEEL